MVRVLDHRSEETLVKSHWPKSKPMEPTLEESRNALACTIHICSL